jgi:hypothetical protein
MGGGGELKEINKERKKERKKGNAVSIRGF